MTACGGAAEAPDARNDAGVRAPTDERGAVEQTEQPADDTIAAADDADGAAAIERDTIRIEGSLEEIAVRRVDSPPGFPLGFTTLVPADMARETATQGEASVVRLEAEFGGVPSPEAFISFAAFPAATDSATASELAGDRAAELGGFPADASIAPWATESFRFSGEYFGFLALGKRNDQWFYFLARYPPEYGDGMGPRIDLILRRWRWSDGGSLATG